MPHGGRRPNSGRKTNAQINNVRTILTDTMTEAQWKALFRRLHELALDGNMRAAALLLNYRFGDPHAAPDPDGPPIEIHTIEARLVEHPRRNRARRLPAPRKSKAPSHDASDDDDYDSDPADDFSPAGTALAPPKSNEWAELDAYYNTDKF